MEIKFCMKSGSGGTSLFLYSNCMHNPYEEIECKEVVGYELYCNWTESDNCLKHNHLQHVLHLVTY